jgi:hypothetical protein
MSKPNKKNISTLTRHDAEKQSKQVVEEMLEELEVTGQESETKAVKWVQEKGKEERKEEVEKVELATEIAEDTSKKGQVFTYRDVIMDEVKRQMFENFDLLPYNFLWYPVKDKKQGIVLWIRDCKGKWYARGMNISMIPKYDINCVERLVIKALDHMDDLDRKYEAEKKALEELKNSAAVKN